MVKGIKFEGLRRAGDPAELARRYNREGIDEVVILDVTATIEGRRALEHTIRAVAQEIFIPLAVGGGIRSEDAGAAAIDAGADKVSLNTAALANPGLITTLATRYGSQAVIVAIDAKRTALSPQPSAGTRGGRERGWSPATGESRAPLWSLRAERPAPREPRGRRVGTRGSRSGGRRDLAHLDRP